MKIHTWALPCGFPNIGIWQKSGFLAFLWISGRFFGDFRCPRAPEIHIFCLKSPKKRKILILGKTTWGRPLVLVSCDYLDCAPSNSILKIKREQNPHLGNSNFKKYLQFFTTLRLASKYGAKCQFKRRSKAEQSGEGHVLFLIEFAFGKKPEPWDIIIFCSPPVTCDTRQIWHHLVIY